MFKEYYYFIREYLKLAQIKTSYLLINIFSALFYKGFSVLLPLCASAIINYLVIEDAKMTYLAISAYFFTYMFYNVSLYVNYKIYGFNMSYCYNNMQTKILNKLISVDNNFTRVFSKGRLMNTINSDVIDIGDMNDRISEFFTGIFQIILVFVILLMTNIYIFIIMLIFAFLYIVVRNIADRRMNYYHRRVQIQDDRYSNLLTQMLSGLQEIKTFNMLPKLFNKLGVIQKNFSSLYSNKRHYNTIRDNDVKIIVYLFRALLYIVSLILMMHGKVDLAGLVLIISYHEFIQTYINDFISASAAIRQVNVAVTRVNDILNYNSEDLHFGQLDTTDIYGSLEFKNVSLSLKKNEILKNISFKVDHNEVVAIVGESGSGKTMILNLILRLFKPTKGIIKIDDINIQDFSKQVYSSNVAVVNQKPFIFNMSIRKNLDFVDRNIKNQIEACKRAGIHEFIQSLPSGYNTILRENGSNISGGQKQMISIARTLLTSSEILLLDDITTSLDPDTAKFVPKILGDLKKDHTIIMITKKPELMKYADRIIVLDKGRIVDTGTHKQLLARNEIYQLLQSRKSPSKIGVFNND